MKAADQAFLKNVTPDAAGPLGLVAGHEPRLDRRDETGVLNLVRVGRAGEPSREARPGHIQPFAQRVDGPDVAVFGPSRQHAAHEPAVQRIKANLIAPATRENALHMVLAPMANQDLTFFRMSRSAGKCATSFFKAQSRPDQTVSARSRETQPLAWPSTPFIQRRNTLLATSRSQAACATATPRSVTDLTSSILNARLSFRRVISTLPFIGRDPIFLSKQPAVDHHRRSSPLSNLRSRRRLKPIWHNAKARYWRNIVAP